MKIIGGHDYYDGAGYGVDETVLFLRNKAVDLNAVDAIEEHPFEMLSPWPFGNTPEGYRGSLTPFAVVIGGRIYPGLEEYRTYNTSAGYRPDEHRYHYDLSSTLEAYDAHCAFTARFIYIANGASDIVADRRERLKGHFSRELTKTELDWLIANKVSVLSTHNRPRGEISVKINHACLKQIEFYKALDPFTTHMEIQSWISGVLPQSKPTLELSDIDKIRKAGFDTKISFRKPPQKRHRG